MTFSHNSFWWLRPEGLLEADNTVVLEDYHLILPTKPSGLCCACQKCRQEHRHL